MMDCASGITRDRAARYASSPASALLGDVNFEYRTVCDVWEPRDLGDMFRGGVVSDIPTLIIHGTWDLSTPIENAREVVSTLTNGQLVEVIRGSHGALYNLYNYWEPMRPTLAAFLRGESAKFPGTVAAPPIDFEPYSGGG